MTAQVAARGGAEPAMYSRALPGVLIWVPRGLCWT